MQNLEGYGGAEGGATDKPIETAINAERKEDKLEEQKVPLI